MCSRSPFTGESTTRSWPSSSCSSVLKSNARRSSANWPLRARPASDRRGRRWHAGPSGIYFVAAGADVEARGWAIPMASDIAFALGALSLVAPRAPGGLKVFLAALAIVDDMGALLVIALFYSTDLAWAALAKAAVFGVALVALNVSPRAAPDALLGSGPGAPVLRARVWRACDDRRRRAGLCDSDENPHQYQRVFRKSQTLARRF